MLLISFAILLVINLIRVWSRRKIGHDATGLTTVFVTYDHKEAPQRADLVVVMSMGRTKQIGKPQDARARPATVSVRDFTGA